MFIDCHSKEVHQKTALNKHLSKENMSFSRVLASWIAGADEFSRKYKEICISPPT